MRKQGTEKIWTRVWHCAAGDCKFRGEDGKCYTPATMFNAEGANCEMYWPGSRKRLRDTTAEVGSCESRSCVFNAEGRCEARGIHVNRGPAGPVCGTFRTSLHMGKNRSRSIEKLEPAMPTVGADCMV